MTMNRTFTKQRRRMACWLLPLFAGLALGGCKTAHMALPPDLPGDATVLAVEGRALSAFGGSFQFGPYQVTDIHRGWTKGSGSSISIGETELSSSKAKQKYRFSFTGPDRTTWNAQCATVADWSDMETGGLLGGRFRIQFSSNQQLVCTLDQNGGGKRSNLVMARSLNKDTKLQGVMVDDAARIDVSVTYNIDGTPIPVSDPTGFVFHIEGRPVGAVQVFNKGTVWIDNAVTPEVRTALAATSAILLLYQDMERRS